VREGLGHVVIDGRVIRLHLQASKLDEIRIIEFPTPFFGGSLVLWEAVASFGIGVNDKSDCAFELAFGSIAYELQSKRLIACQAPPIQQIQPMDPLRICVALFGRQLKPMRRLLSVKAKLTTLIVQLAKCEL
jgi:hypothetical protein